MKAPHQSRFPFHPVSHSDYIITPSESLFFHYHPVPKPFFFTDFPSLSPFGWNTRAGLQNSTILLILANAPMRSHCYWCQMSVWWKHYGLKASGYCVWMFIFLGDSPMWPQKHTHRIQPFTQLQWCLVIRRTQRSPCLSFHCGNASHEVKTYCISIFVVDKTCQDPQLCSSMMIYNTDRLSKWGVSRNELENQSFQALQ